MLCRRPEIQSNLPRPDKHKHHKRRQRLDDGVEVRAMTAPLQVPWTTSQTVAAVRPQVREVLTAIPSFAQMSPEERAKLAGNMVKVLSYIANPNGVADEAVTPALVSAMEEDAVDATKKSLSKSPGMVGDKFK